MQEPSRHCEEPDLKLVASEASPVIPEKEVTTSYAGGGGGPPLMKDNSGLWMFCAVGCVMIVLSLLALWKEPATATYHQAHSISFGDLRVFCELLFLVIGSACLATAGTCLRAQAQARKVEKGTDGRVKSLRAKKLEHVSDDSIFQTIGNYISALIGII
jgi:hypothetical protein